MRMICILLKNDVDKDIIKARLRNCMREGKIAVIGDKDLILAFKAISMSILRGY